LIEVSVAVFTMALVMAIVVSTTFRLGDSLRVNASFPGAVRLLDDYVVSFKDGVYTPPSGGETVTGTLPGGISYVLTLSMSSHPGLDMDRLEAVIEWNPSLSLSALPARLRVAAIRKSG